MLLNKKEEVFWQKLTIMNSGIEDDILYKLVLVDDEGNSRRALAEYFPWARLGFTVSAQFNDGLRALEYLRNNPVDVLFCDIIMPNLNGLELAKAVHEEGIRCTIVFLSAHQNFEYARKALSYGVYEYLVKPLKYEELLSVFQKLREKLDLEAKDSFRPAVSDSPKDRVVQMIDQYLAENYQCATLNTVSSHLNMNSSYLSTYYYSNTGCHFSDALLKIRMEKAKELLSDSRYQIQEISEMVGYTDAKAFSRAFKRYYGTLPRDFRKTY